MEKDVCVGGGLYVYEYLCRWVFAYSVFSMCEQVCDVVCHPYVGTCVMQYVFSVWPCAHDMICYVYKHMCLVCLHVFLDRYVSGLVYLCPVVVCIPSLLYSLIFRQTSYRLHNVTTSHYLCLWGATVSADWSYQNPDMSAGLPSVKLPSNDAGKWGTQQYLTARVSVLDGT